MDPNINIFWERSDLLLVFLLAVLSTGLLLLVSRWICKEPIDARDAFFSALAAVGIGTGADLLLRIMAGQQTEAYWLLSAIAYCVIWTLSLIIIIGIELIQALVLAVIATALRLGLMALFFSYNA